MIGIGNQEDKEDRAHPRTAGRGRILSRVSGDQSGRATEMFTGRPGNPAAIVMDASLAYDGDGKSVRDYYRRLHSAPYRACQQWNPEDGCTACQSGRLFFDKGILLALILAVVFAIETAALYFCTWEMAWRREADPVSLCKTMDILMPIHCRRWC